ncbi:MAG: PfkB family carbohydrate kinase, partial [Pseudomonadota bacterium]
MFVVCGEALWDLFGAEGSDGLTFDARIGGSPFNVAVGLARLGQASALFTGLSTDRLGQRLHDALVAEGVATGLL